jgi:TRAP-type C4-dicarboxylate transport system substrate-binding protein
MTHWLRLGLGIAAAAWAAGMVPAKAQSPTTTEAELQALAQNMKPFTVRAVGLPTGASEWGFLEKPFWTEKVSALSGGKVSVKLNSMSELNLQGGEVFRLTSQGTFDVADIVANYGAGDLPQLDGMDLAGVAQSPEEQTKVLDAYAPVFTKALKDRFRLVTLGYAHSTAQVFFCKPQISSAVDFRGKKVRLSSSTLADVVTGLGGSPVTMTFAEVVPAMQRGVLDCVITGTMSGNTGKFYEVADYVVPLVVGWAPRLRIVSGRFWDSLDEGQKAWLQKASDYYFKEFGDAIEKRNNNEGIWCSVGDQRCTLDGQFGVKKAGMRLVPISDSDRAMLREAVSTKVLPSFAAACGEPCAAEWTATIGKVMNLTAKR